MIPLFDSDPRTNPSSNGHLGVRSFRVLGSTGQTEHWPWFWWGIGALVVAAMLAFAPARAKAIVTVNNPRVVEGNSGFVNLNFTISSDSSDCASWATVAQTAQSPSDYTHTTGYECPLPSSMVVSVPVNGDTMVESDETLLLRVSMGEFGEVDGTGTIVNDDQGAGPDTDGDGVPDSSDACPTVHATTPNGCPATTEDTDNDGVPNSTDQCPMVAGPPPSGCPLDGALPPPVRGSTVNLYVFEDDVFVKTPAGAAAAQARRSKGQGFVPLTEHRQVAVGSLIDVKNGLVGLESAADTAGASNAGTFTGGIFQVLQSRRRGTPTVLRLKGRKASFRRCGRSAAATATSAARRRLSRRAVRRLRSNAIGSFRTRGRHSAATVRGTVWVTTDRCDGTLTRVRRGRVAVRDFRRRRTVIVRAGKSYLARAPG